MNSTMRAEVETVRSGGGDSEDLRYKIICCFF